MARTNYSFEKRQRELAKKKKQEEKRQRKSAHKSEGGTDGQGSEPAGDADGADTLNATPPAEPDTKG
jgi:hypothetical protein